MKNGFTLVELSIVLVIIGLLTGGILVAQSLITSAKINSEVRKLTQYSMAFVNFKDRYKQEAGDSILFPHGGNNDGDLLDTQGLCPGMSSEAFSTWDHVTAAGMITGERYEYSPMVPCGYSTDPTGTLPTHEIEATGQTVGLSYIAGLILTSPSIPFGPPPTYGPITFGGKTYHRAFSTSYDSEIVWGLENKLDDGVASSTNGTISSNAAAPFLSPSYDCTPSGIEQTISTYGESYNYCQVNIFFSQGGHIPILP